LIIADSIIAIYSVYTIIKKTWIFNYCLIQEKKENKNRKAFRKPRGCYKYQNTDEGVFFSEALLAAKQICIAMAPTKLFFFAFSVALIFAVVGAKADVSVEGTAPEPDASAFKIQLDQLNSKIRILGVFSSPMQNENLTLLLISIFHFPDFNFSSCTLRLPKCPPLRFLFLGNFYFEIRTVLWLWIVVYNF